MTHAASALRGHLSGDGGGDRRAQDHRADVLGGGGLEDVRATARAVADVVAHEVRDHGGVAWVVLRDARLDLADEVRANVRRLGIDAAAELREERDEAGAEAEADDGLRRAKRIIQSAEDEVDDGDAEQAERDDEEAGDRAATQRDHQRLAQAAPRRAGDANIGLHRDLHADVASDAGADRADGEGDGGAQADVEGVLAKEAAFRERGQQHADHDGGDGGEHGDGGVLAAQERLRAGVDGVGDLLHLRRAGIVGEYPARQPKGEEDCDETGADGNRQPPHDAHEWTLAFL